MSKKTTARASTAFRDRYSNPVVTNAGACPIPGLSFVTVYDEADVAKDPLIPSPWLQAEDGRMFEATNSGFREALESVKYVPSSPQEALSLARFYAMAVVHGQRAAQVWEGIDSWSQIGIKCPPAMERIMATVPRVVREGNVAAGRPRPAYTVTLCRVSAANGDWLMPREESVEELTVRVGPGLFDAVSRMLWTTRRVDAVENQGLPGQEPP